MIDRPQLRGPDRGESGRSRITLGVWLAIATVGLLAVTAVIWIVDDSEPRWSVQSPISFGRPSPPTTETPKRVQPAEKPPMTAEGRAPAPAEATTPVPAAPEPSPAEAERMAVTEPAEAVPPPAAPPSPAAPSEPERTVAPVESVVPPAGAMTTEISDVSPPVRLFEKESTALAHVLNRYEQAYDRLDASGAAEVWPSVDSRALSRAFARLQAQNLEFHDCTFAVSADDAAARCAGVLHYARRIGDTRPKTEPHVWTIEFARSGETWQIVRVTAQ